MWLVECKQASSTIWPTDLVYDPRWPIIELDPDITQTNILTKFEKDLTKIVAYRVLTTDIAWSGKLTLNPSCSGELK